MKIYKYHPINSTESINTISINSNQTLIAFGDSNNQITIYKYQNLLLLLSSQPKQKFNLKYSKEILCEIIPNSNLQKIIFSVQEKVNKISFPNTMNNFLFSGGSDKLISIWKISQEIFSGEKVKTIILKNEITDFKFYPTDQFLFVSCIDNNIYILRCNYSENSFDIIYTIKEHDNIVNSIVLDPFIEITGRFASISNKGRLIISQINLNNNNFYVKTIKNFNEFVYEKHKCMTINKKIDWSVDGNFLLSVDHHILKGNKNLMHCRIINMNNNYSNSILIGHESPVFICKFSKCFYYNNNSKDKKESFMLCATCDRNGSVIIWKIKDNKFTIFVVIDDYSESNINDLLWSENGKILFSVNSSGTVGIIAFYNLEVFEKKKKY